MCATLTKKLKAAPPQVKEDFEKRWVGPSRIVGVVPVGERRWLVATVSGLWDTTEVEAWVQFRLWDMVQNTDTTKTSESYFLKEEKEVGFRGVDVQINLNTRGIHATFVEVGDHVGLIGLVRQDVKEVAVKTRQRLPFSASPSAGLFLVVLSGKVQQFTPIRVDALGENRQQVGSISIFPGIFGHLLPLLSSLPKPILSAIWPAVAFLLRHAGRGELVVGR